MMFLIFAVQFYICIDSYISILRLNGITIHN